jgi:hypothetical protein
VQVPKKNWTSGKSSKWQSHDYTNCHQLLTPAFKISTRRYVAAGYASIFACTSIEDLQNRAIGLSELKLTGRELSLALEKRHGKLPKTIVHSVQKVQDEVEECLRSGSRFALAWYCRLIWRTGQQAEMVGNDMWEVEDSPKASLEDLMIKGELKQYRDIPMDVKDYFRQTFR